MPPPGSQFVDLLTDPKALHSRQAILTRPCPAPAVHGLYAWYFTDLPNAPLRDSPWAAPFRLAYVGVAPGRSGSRATLRSRIRQHLRGNASTSTLRLTLGCLLASQLGLRLVPTGRTRRLTWGPDGEQALSVWLDRNARVVWTPCPDPWIVEPDVVLQMEPSLNLQHNREHPFYAELLDYRRQARLKAGI